MLAKFLPPAVGDEPWHLAGGTLRIEGGLIPQIPAPGVLSAGLLFASISPMALWVSLLGLGSYPLVSTL